MTSNALKTKTLFLTTTPKAKEMILSAIARHYGITTAQAETEVTGPEAESLLDYMTEPARSATQALIKRHGLDAL